MKIIIETIKHSQQRYNTCGDYYYSDYAGADMILVSHLPDRREILLVAIHELIEMALCQVKGISNASIDAFDKEFDELVFTGGEEPGDRVEAPYYHQHQIATGIERILAAEMGVDWLAYERHIQELSR